MSERVERFEINQAPRIEVKLGRGTVRCLPGVPGQVEVRISGRHPDEIVVELIGDTVTIAPVSGSRATFDLSLLMPEGGSVKASLASADLGIHVALGSLEASVASGDIEVAAPVDELTAKIASGDLTVATVEHLKAASASGDIEIATLDRAGKVSTASGDVDVKRARGELSLRTASGDLDIEVFEGEDLDLKTVSGDAVVGIPAGRTVDLDIKTLTGDIDLPEPGDGGPSTGKVRIKFSSVSGDFEIVRRS